MTLMQKTIKCQIFVVYMINPPQGLKDSLKNVGYSASLSLKTGLKADLRWSTSTFKLS